MGDVNQLLRKIPKVDELLKMFDSSFSKDLLKYLINDLLEEKRGSIKRGENTELDIQSISTELKDRYLNFIKGSLFRVINCTGIAIHTNFGRSPIDEDVFDDAKELVCGYSNLEYDLEKGERGERYLHCSNYINYLTGAEDSIVVNNNAAAVFLILNTFAKECEVIVSRGELIEIGGSFRLPEVMMESGAILREVGTTNKTRPIDYINGINEKSSLIMKSHKSNYKIVGFTEDVSLEEIASISKKYGLVSYYDAGSGAIEDFFKGDCFESSIKNNFKSGVDLISFSGDKLLGGPQCGIIAGRKDLIGKLKKNQILRMLRVDKLTISILQGTLRKYILNKKDKPIDRIFEADSDKLKKKSKRIANILKNELADLEIG
ncbi:MAG: L-seryl-tRNA(Sec) selenium transferase, partial [Calditerrivibrio sp.]|nr:L-seryl-tRNA(Sec) selenium transferase [Calditerrivibrio sp.]